MKKAVILHGTDGAPEHNWFPWLKTKLEENGYEVFVPLLPNNHTPNRIVYNNFLIESEWDFTDNLVVGHSSGAVSTLNLLEDDRFPRIKTAVLVGVWADTEGTDLSVEQFKDLFSVKGFDFEIISKKVNEIIYIHGDDDPYCPLDQAKWLAAQTNSDIKIIPGGKHLSERWGWRELPQLVEVLQHKNLL